MSDAGGRGAGGRTFILTLAVLALLGVVAFLLSERNARQYTLVEEDGVLSVKKGVMAPMGRTAFKTDDPKLAAAYAPLKPPPGFKLGDERVFEERGALDQALYELLSGWARDDIASEKPERVARALAWLDRAEKLAGISAAQREDLRALRAESGYFEARDLLERAVETLRRARDGLRLTAGSRSRHAGEANQALSQVDPAIDEAYRAARVLGSSAPPPQIAAPPDATQPPLRPGAPAPAGADGAAGGAAPAPPGASAPGGR